MTRTRDPDGVRMSDRAMLASYLVAMFVVGPTLGLIGLALPHAADADDAGILAVAGSAYVVGALIHLYRRRLPDWSFDVAAALGTLLISASIYFAGSSVTTGAFFYVWVVIGAAYFFDRPRVAVQLLIVATGYATALALKPSAPGMVQAWIVTMGTLAVAAALFVITRERVASLVARLAEAADTDPLTGLLNRRGFGKQLELELERAERSGTACEPDQRRSRSLQAGQRPLRPPGGRRGSGPGRRGASPPRPQDRLRRPGRRRGVRAAGSRHRLARRLRLRRAAAPPDPRGVRRPDPGSRSASGSPPIPATASRPSGCCAAPTSRSTRPSPSAATGACSTAARSSARSPRTRRAGGRDRAQPRDPADPGRGARPSRPANGPPRRDRGPLRRADRRRARPRPGRVERVRLAGVLHDIGKIGIADSILFKEGPLDDEEWAEIRSHPEIGARLLSAPGLSDLRAWILAHHERVDGDGYPLGLSGDEIPLEARIIAVADAFEAMLADRPYRAGRSRAEALAELERCAGTQFDAEVVAALAAASSRATSPVSGP